MGSPGQDMTALAATELAERIAEGVYSPTDVTQAFLERIEERNERLQAFVTVTDELARDTAHQRATAEDPGPLHGVPVALKDLGNMKAGIRHTMGSKLVDDLGFEAPRTSIEVERLEEAGAVILGKTNTPELGHKGTTDNKVLGPTASPIDPTLNAGGSSGGSAAAVGDTMVPIALGSDAGGSIRIPAAACGVYGLKPTFGLVPMESRPNAFGKTLHHTTTGPLTRTVADAALVMDVIAGPHPRDPASVPVDIAYQAALDRSNEEMRIAFSPDLDVFTVEDEVLSVVEAAVHDLAGAGATVDRVDIEHGLTMDELGDAVETTFTTTLLGAIETIDAAFGLDFREHPDQVSETLLELVAIGEEKSVAELARTGIVRTEVFDAVEDIFEDYDLIATPTVGIGGVPLEAELGPDAWDVALTWPFNWTGHPAASAPAGLTAAGEPVGLQLIGPRFEDDTVLAASAALEAARPWLPLHED